MKVSDEKNDRAFRELVGLQVTGVDIETDEQSGVRYYALQLSNDTISGEISVVPMTKVLELLRSAKR